MNEIVSENSFNMKINQFGCLVKHEWNYWIGMHPYGGRHVRGLGYDRHHHPWHIIHFVEMNISNGENGDRGAKRVLIIYWLIAGLCEPIWWRRYFAPLCSHQLCIWYWCLPMTRPIIIWVLGCEIYILPKQNFCLYLRLHWGWKMGGRRVVQSTVTLHICHNFSMTDNTIHDFDEEPAEPIVSFTSKP